MNARIEKTDEQSSALSEIDALVAKYKTCGENTVDAVRSLIIECESETAWAKHYCDKLSEARRLGYLPDSFSF